MVSKKPPSKPGLEHIALWKGLAPDALQRVRARCRWKSYGAGEEILSYLDRSDDVYFITEGDVRVTIFSLQGSVVMIGDLGAGEIFGEMAAIDGQPRSASIVALTPCTIASMPSSAFREAARTEPSVGWELSRILTRKLRSLTTRMYELSTLDVANRTRAELLRLAKSAPQQGKSAIISPVPTQAEIASRISSKREVVARELLRLRDLGIVDRRKGALVVCDVDRLAEMVHTAVGE
jgi:CRP/FNR family transcriptional regulator, cyclic AMP receptor protein